MVSVSAMGAPSLRLTPRMVNKMRIARHPPNPLHPGHTQRNGRDFWWDRGIVFGRVFAGFQHSRPAIWEGRMIPQVLRSGDHATIDA